MWFRYGSRIMFAKVRQTYTRTDISTGCYVLLAVPNEEKYHNEYRRFKALSVADRSRVLNPLKPVDIGQRTNCWIHKMQKPVTRGWFKVIGTRDGIMVKTIAKAHKRSKPNTNFKWSMQVRLNNIIDVAQTRDAMIAKRDR